MSETETTKKRTRKNTNTNKETKVDVVHELKEENQEENFFETNNEETSVQDEKTSQLETVETFELVRLKDIDVHVGLTEEEAQKRIAHGYCNVNNIKTTKTTWQIVRGNIFTFFNMLYLIITVLLCIARSWTNLTFLAVIIPNLILGIVQELKAKKMIEKLSLVSAPRAVVVRDGEEKEITTSEIVLDDIIQFTTGKQIVTDSIVAEGTVEVNESMITGESDAIVKNPGDLLYSGSYVTSGSCYARVENVSKDNYIEKLATEAKQQKEKQ